ncbi:MAG: cation transporting ATPase C-terminal domain-containing protein [Spirochaetaceae bacterium]|nr:cation transporting ATPase C-terminal domain-containing protein [Spirochaetaceae bacterium]
MSAAGVPGGGWHPAALALTRIFHGFNCRSDKSIFAIKFTSNTWSIWAFLAGVVLLALVMVVPVLSRLFSVAALDRSQLLSILGLAFLPTLVIQMVKAIRDKVRG